MPSKHKYHVGQRVRLAMDGMSMGIPSARAGMFVDITECVSMSTNYHGVVLTGDTKNPRLDGGHEYSFSESWLAPVRGKPYVEGVDPKREFGNKEGLAKRASKSKHDSRPATADATHHTPSAGESDMTAMSRADITAIATEAAAKLYTERAGSLAEAVQEDVNAQLADAGLADTAEVVKTLSARLDAVLNIATTMPPKVKARARMASAKGGNVFLDKLSPYYVAGHEPPINPVLLVSPPSFGKSFAVRKLGETYDAYFEHGCSDDIDEIVSLLGGPVPDGKGGFIVVDGVLVEALRMASEGKNVLFLFDEVLRLSSRAQETLLTFLTGVKRPDGSRWWRLRTRRATTHGEFEVLEAPVKNLHFIGATNLGLNNPVPAFWSRWTHVRVEFSVDHAVAQGNAILTAWGISDHEPLSKLFADIVKQSRDMASKGRLRFPVDFRMLEGAAFLHRGEDGGTVAKEISARLADATANWQVDTGDVDADGVAVCKSWALSLDKLA